LRILVMLYTIPAVIVWLGSGLMGLDPGTRALCCECPVNPPEPARTRRSHHLEYPHQIASSTLPF
jgi:hypothetical protein